MSSSSSSAFKDPVLAVACLSALAAASLVVLQTDACSRRLLTEESLHTKRRSEYVYGWTQALQRAALRLQYARIAGGFAKFDAEEELLNTSFPQTDDQIQEVVDMIIEKCCKSRRNQNKESTEGATKEEPFVRIARIGTVHTEVSAASKEFFVWLYTSDQQIYRLPLTKFGLKLAEALERQIISAAFCFIADASAGCASEFVLDVVRACTPKDGKIYFEIDQPLWLVNLAALVERRVLSSETMEKLVFAFMRLEALRAPPTATTILVRLPGMATTPMLLPLLQSVFPDDRLVYSYTGCVATVQYSLQKQKLYHKKYHRSYVPKSLDEAICFEDPVTFATPLNGSLAKSANVMKRYKKALASLPLDQADTVETWMTAIDAYFQLKEKDEENKTNAFLPYVFRLDFLMDEQDKMVEGAARYWSLRSLLQYVTGSKSRELPSEMMDAAISFVTDYCSKSIVTEFTTPSSKKVANDSSKVDRKAIENAVFQHKLILIENKTIKDTVLPQQHWTLKAAGKKGCACCLPEDEEEQEAALARMMRINNALAAKNAGEGASGGVGDPNSGSSSAAAKPKGYVDGKTMFAFDPTRFS